MLSLFLFLCLSVRVILAAPVREKGRFLKSREIALQFRAKKAHRLFAFGEYHRNTPVLVISYDMVFNLRRVQMVVTCDETMTEKGNVLPSRERKLCGARFLRKTSLVFHDVYFLDDSEDDWKIGNSSIDVHITVIP